MTNRTKTEPTKAELVRAYRESWEAKRTDMIKWLIDEKKFNPKYAPKCADNSIDSFVFAFEESLL